jgi:hypothetical protein
MAYWREAISAKSRRAQLLRDFGDMDAAIEAQEALEREVENFKQVCAALDESISYSEAS